MSSRFPVCRAVAQTREPFEPKCGGHRYATRSGLPQEGSEKWGAEAGRDEAGSYLQLSLLNHFWEILKPERVGRDR